jgi:hypothetical protein
VRPAGGGWDIGAYEEGTGLAPRPNAPTGLQVVWLLGLDLLRDSALEPQL